MDWPILVRCLGIGLSVASGVWLWRLRRQGAATRNRMAIAIGLMALGLAADLWPVACAVGAYVLFEVLGFVAFGENWGNSRRSAPLAREDDPELPGRGSIETELERREEWARSVHRAKLP